MQHMRDTYSFTPSKRAYQTQFKRWGFPSKQNPAHRNADLVSRVKELWEANFTQRDMLKTLNEEGYELKERELMRLRAKNRWLLRIPNGMKQYSIDTNQLNEFQNELLVAAGVPTEIAHSSERLPEAEEDPSPETTAELEEVMRKRKERHDQMQQESDERYLAKKRRRRTREYAGIAADPPAPPRFPSETTLEEGKVILQLDLAGYRALRDQFQQICEEEGVIKKTLAGTDKWKFVKHRLIAENEHLQQVFLQDKADKAIEDSKQLALDVIATDVTKRMRGIGRRMTIIEAKNALGLNPEQSRQVRNSFYQTLQKDKFTSKLETGPEHWQELKDQWLSETPMLTDLFVDGEADPKYEEKQKALEALCRDVMKRLRDDQSKRKKNPEKIPPKPTPVKSATQRAGPVATAAAATKALAAAQQPEQSAYQFTADLSDLQIDPTLLEAANSYPVPSPPPVAVYVRPHPSSEVHKDEKMWLGSLTPPTVTELRNLVTRHWPNAPITRIDGAEKDPHGQDLSYLIEEDDELEAYLEHVKGRKAIFVVLLNRP